MKIKLFVFLLLYPTIRRVLLFFSISLSISQPQSLNVSKSIIITITKSTNLGLFFALNAIVIVVLMGNSKSPRGDSELFFSLPSLEFEVEYVEEKEKDEDYIERTYSSISLLANVEYEEEADEYYIERTHNSIPLLTNKEYYEESHNNKAEDFVPRLVYVEYNRDIVLADHYNDKDNEGSFEVDDSYGGYDYVVNSEEKEEEDDLGKRAEEFIAKVYQKWKEELIQDRLLLITAS